MLRIIERLGAFYRGRNRWWLPPAAGVLYAACLPPFDRHASALLAPFPLLGFIILIPLFVFATCQSRRRALVHCYLFGVTASLSQFYWIANDTAEGVWYLILVGVGLMSLVLALLFLAAGAAFRALWRRFPVASIVLFPAAWVTLEYARTLGEIAFPWGLLGYSLTSMLPLAQLASVCGVFGLSFLVVTGNVIIFRFVNDYRARGALRLHDGLGVIALVAVVAGAALWGALRLHGAGTDDKDDVTVSLLQTNMNQNRWGNMSLDTCFSISESLALRAAQAPSDLVIMPESALLCYLVRRQALKNRVLGWMDSVKTPMLIGALHWEPAAGAVDRFDVYNTAFFLDRGSRDFRPYFKIRLVPFSEALPFEGAFPILSRVNLGEADFRRGTNPAVFATGKIRAAPFICYEIIFPDFVRRRVRAGANLLVNMTNDGWFGRSTAPYQHAAMARMRCIEDGVSLARCANSGISMLVDQYGRTLCATRLFERGVLRGTVPLHRVPTLYYTAGDWPVWVSLALLAVAGVAAIARRRVPPGQVKAPRSPLPT